MVSVRVKARKPGGLAGMLRKIAGQHRGPTGVEVGFLDNATYPDGTDVPTVAAANEFGTDKIPPRPFFRTTIAKKKGEWGPALALQLKATDYDVERSLLRVGEGIKGQIQQGILDMDSPPLAEATIARKGFDKPLIDTGVMIRSVDYRVK